jgi:hypothetical protein
VRLKVSDWYLPLDSAAAAGDASVVAADDRLNDPTAGIMCLSTDSY